MLIGQLTDFVLRAEKGEGEGMPFWVSVPGSVITGNLVSRRQMISQVSEAMMAGASISDQATISIATDMIVNKEEQSVHSLEGVANAHFLNATIFQGDKIIQTTLAIVDLSAVAAWGFGSFEPAE